MTDSGDGETREQRGENRLGQVVQHSQRSEACQTRMERAVEIVVGDPQLFQTIEIAYFGRKRGVDEMEISKREVSERAEQAEGRIDGTDAWLSRANIDRSV